MFDGLASDQVVFMNTLETSQGLLAQNLQTHSVESFLSHFAKSSVNNEKSVQTGEEGRGGVRRRQGGAKGRGRRKDARKGEWIQEKKMVQDNKRKETREDVNKGGIKRKWRRGEDP